ncbi:MAG: imelysin family protein [Burkholderiales bacterium]|nr:imelysin family protein [Burkholderiales bacterium]
MLSMLAAGLAGPASVMARQGKAPRAAVPYYGPVQVLQGLHRHWTAPRAAEFVAKAAVLTPALRQLCAAPAASAATAQRAARDAWREAMLAWEQLSAAPLGPLVQRRSLRAIDFTPTRPALIEKAVAALEKTGSEPALDRIGTPAKGLPALEWLLWSGPAMPGTAACRYALLIAGEVEREAVALRAAFAELAAREAGAWSEEAVIAGVSELVNQWVGGIERLRWPRLEKPLRAGRPAEWPRAASGATGASWAAQWQALRALAVLQGGAPQPGAGLVPLELWLRGQGLGVAADRLAQAVRRTDARMRGLAPGGRVQDAARELAALKYLAESEIAPALNVRIGFSDADGD